MRRDLGLEPPPRLGVEHVDVVVVERGEAAAEEDNLAVDKGAGVCGAGQRDIADRLWPCQLHRLREIL